VNASIKKIVLFLGCEFICFFLLTLIHLNYLKEDLGIMAFYEEEYEIPYSITVYVPVLFGVGLISFAFFLNGNRNIWKILPTIIPISIAFILFFENLKEFNYYIYTYFPYLVILTILWGVVFILHWGLEALMKKDTKKY
jgi:hypothetical protein